MMDSELKDLLKVALDPEADWEDRVSAFKDAVSVCQEPEMEDEEAYDTEDEDKPPMGKGLMMVFGPGKPRRK